MKKIFFTAIAVISFSGSFANNMQVKIRQPYCEWYATNMTMSIEEASTDCLTSAEYNQAWWCFYGLCRLNQM